ncbi:hypothetical protein Tco_0358253 [Tanacetum coccineum]
MDASDLTRGKETDCDLKADHKRSTELRTAAYTDIDSDAVITGTCDHTTRTGDSTTGTGYRIAGTRWRSGSARAARGW